MYDDAAADQHSDVLEGEMSAEMEVDAMENTRPAALSRKGKVKKRAAAAARVVSSDDDAEAAPDRIELQMSKEMEPSLERTKGATGGLRKRRPRTAPGTTDEGHNDLLEMTPAVASAARGRDNVELLMSEEMQASLVKTTKRALVARRGRGRPKRVGGSENGSAGFAAMESSAAGVEGGTDIGGLGMSTEMELSAVGGESGRRLLRAAAGEARPRRSRHYTDVEIAGDESGGEEAAEDDDQVMYQIIVIRTVVHNPRC